MKPGDLVRIDPDVFGDYEPWDEKFIYLDRISLYDIAQWSSNVRVAWHAGEMGIVISKICDRRGDELCVLVPGGYGFIYESYIIPA